MPLLLLPLSSLQSPGKAEALGVLLAVAALDVTLQRPSKPRFVGLLYFNWDAMKVVEFSFILTFDSYWILHVPSRIRTNLFVHSKLQIAVIKYQSNRCFMAVTISW